MNQEVLHLRSGRTSHSTISIINRFLGKTSKTVPKIAASSDRRSVNNKFSHRPSENPQNCPIPLGGTRPHLIHGSTAHANLSTNGILIAFCRAHPSAQQTDKQTHTQTTLSATSVAIRCAMSQVHARRRNS